MLQAVSSASGQPQFLGDFQISVFFTRAYLPRDRRIPLGLAVGRAVHNQAHVVEPKAGAAEAALAAGN